MSQVPPTIPTYDDPGVLRLASLADLQQAYTINFGAIQLLKIDMDANACAHSHFKRLEGEQERAEQHSVRHGEIVAELAHRLKFCCHLQTEINWRMDNPMFDPDSPFEGE